MSKHSLRAMALATGMVVVVGGIAFGLSTASATVAGSATLTPSTGTSLQSISITTSGTCASPATKVRAIATGFGFPANGQVVLPPTTVGFSTTSAMTLPLSNTFKAYATTNSATALVGDYDVRVQCVTTPGQVQGEFPVTMTWTTPGNSYANIDSATYTSTVIPTTTAPPTTTPPPTTTAPPTTTPPTTTAPPVLPPVNNSKPYLVGSAKVGGTLSCRSGSWTGASTLAFRWLRNGVSITGATASSYKLNGYDYARYVSCRVTASNTGGSTAAFSASIKIAAGTFSCTKAPAISGSARVGRTVYASKGSWSPSPTTYAYQWLRSGKAIRGAYKSSYKISSSDRGKYVSVRVTVKKGGYYTASKTSRSVRAS